MNAHGLHTIDPHSSNRGDPDTWNVFVLPMNMMNFRLTS